MKTAIVYYSLNGNTRMVAERVAAAIGADLIELKPEKAYPDTGFKKFIWGGSAVVMGRRPKLQPYEFDADRYERIIFGTPVWASSFSPPLKSFIAEQREALAGKRFAVFTCYAGSGAAKTVEKLSRELGVEKFEAGLFLIDPKDHPDDDTDRKIAEFCEVLQ